MSNATPAVSSTVRSQLDPTAAELRAFADVTEAQIRAAFLAVELQGIGHQPKRFARIAAERWATARRFEGSLRGHGAGDPPDEPTRTDCDDPAALRNRFQQLVRWARAAADGLGSTLSTVPTGPKAVAAQSNREADELAAIVTLGEVGPNLAEIARRIGRPRSTIMGWKAFRARFEQMKADAEVRRAGRRGSRSGETDFAARD